MKITLGVVRRWKLVHRFRTLYNRCSKARVLVYIESSCVFDLSCLWYRTSIRHVRGTIDNSTRNKLNCQQIHFRSFHTTKPQTINDSRRYVLGIETSCDDTGAAIVDSDGNIIGEALNSQTDTHVQFGGILPPIARDLHKKHIKNVVSTAIERSGMEIMDIDAIATTVKPGMKMSLRVGLDYTKELLLATGKPFIPIHHMEAHALTARMLHHNVIFPFLVLLVSGGHCLLALARDVDDFLLLGKGLDDAPGDAFDKTAREMGLKNIHNYSGLSGGQSIEKMAETGKPSAFSFPAVMSQIPNCNFSFAGPKFHAKKIIRKSIEEHGVTAPHHLPNLPDICASFQYGVLRHLAKRIQRAFLFCDLHQLIPGSNKFLVMSGGVASNQFIREGMKRMCQAYDYDLICPPIKLCTDNGVMIAWNGMEKLKKGIGICEHPENVEIVAKCPLGKDITEDVEKATIKLKRIKLIDH